MKIQIRKVYIDEKEVKYLIYSKLYYTWFKLKDGTIKKTNTYHYEKERNNKSDIYLKSIGEEI